MLTNAAKTSKLLHASEYSDCEYENVNVRFSVLCSRNYLPFENRSKSMDTAFLKTKVLCLTLILLT
jgi:hypothetical protein